MRINDDRVNLTLSLRSRESCAFTFSTGSLDKRHELYKVLLV